MKANDFEILVKARYPQLFGAIKPITLSSVQDITNDLDSQPDWTMDKAQTQRYVARFIATYTKSPLYILSVCRSFLHKENRTGLHKPEPILRGEVLELLTYAHRTGLGDLQTHSMYRYFEGCERELEYEPVE